MLKFDQLFIVAPTHLEEGEDPAVAVLYSQIATGELAKPPLSAAMGLPVGAVVEGFAVVPGLTVGFLVVGFAVQGLTAAVGLIVGFGVLF